jgi:hypothetical protein
LPGFTIGYPKYPGSPSGLGGYEFLPLGSNGQLAKTLFTFLGMFSCKLTKYVPLGICGLYLILTIV